MSRTYCEFMNESSVFTGYCCSCNLVQIWCRDPIATLMSMQHLGCLVLHEALTICLFSTWFSRTTWHQMYLDCLGLFRGCSNFEWMALQDKCKHDAKELCSVFFQFLWMVAILLSDVGVSLVSLRMYMISYRIISYVILNDFLMVIGCFGAFHGDVLGRYGMDQFHRFIHWIPGLQSSGCTCKAISTVGYATVMVLIKIDWFALLLSKTLFFQIRMHFPDGWGWWLLLRSSYCIDVFAWFRTT